MKPAGFQKRVSSQQVDDGPLLVEQSDCEVDLQFGRNRLLLSLEYRRETNKAGAAGFLA
jgi:hypothetical protein